MGEQGPELVVPQANPWTQALEQYPILGQMGIQGVVTPGPSKYGGGIESWPIGETGEADYPRPTGLASNVFGVQIFDPEKTRPIDVLADVASHYMVYNDPKMKQFYQDFRESLTPRQQEKLQRDYEYAKQNLGETRPFDVFVEHSRLPGFFRGYTFGQWPEKYNKELFTPDQIKLFDKVRRYLGVKDVQYPKDDSE